MVRQLFSDEDGVDPLADYASDEEQLEALKRWWKENGTSLLTGVVVVLAVYFGIGRFQDSQSADSGRASDLYQQLSDLGVENMTTAISADSLLAAQSVYSQLKADHADSIYSRYAALLMARFQVERNDLDKAAAELQWILDNPDLGFMREADPELFVIARLRLARIKLGQGDAQGALALIQSEPVGEEFIPGYAEVEGDIHFALGDREAARAAYQKAFTALAASGTGNPTVLRLKLQELGINPSEAL
jgi:predicted negative regulator of RcsB-dependent stress response